eukprot:CAMPEP_0115889474 /NCGR_PEP_ID=MMETSP0287-20121206/32844_1 /TAXON_ID=412157 /ORGANISM="Chrysochromulina rotalis, Strain UIO044" /LENGTH=54 /DNA_ID=CAMNT_0003346195 /DNA_START=30 /DNA_END=194 /DNA_ORIENTATION=+
MARDKGGRTSLELTRLHLESINGEDGIAIRTLQAVKIAFEQSEREQDDASLAAR